MLKIFKMLKIWIKGIWLIFRGRDNELVALLGSGSEVGLLPVKGKLEILQGSYDKGIIDLEKVLETMPDDHADWVELSAYIGMGYIGKNDYRSAKPHLLSALEGGFKDGDFKRVDLIYNMGWIFLNEKEYEEAKRTFLEGDLLEPSHPDIKFGLGCVCYHLEQKKEAYQYLNDALDLEPELINHSTMSDLLKELGGIPS
jgi:tetratricopeptide (TPR) repeat protein